MEIKIFNEKDIQKFKTNKKHIVISIQDPNSNFVKLPKQKSRIGWLGLQFYDLDKDTGYFPYGGAYDGTLFHRIIPNFMIHRFLFEFNHAKHILEFVGFHKNNINLVIINCVAGISRSAGVAGALSKILNNDDSYYFKHYCPNMRVYRTILEEYYNNVKMYQM